MQAARQYQPYFVCRSSPIFSTSNESSYWRDSLVCTLFHQSASFQLSGDLIEANMLKVGVKVRSQDVGTC
jgi:hypothetical protein